MQELTRAINQRNEAEAASKAAQHGGQLGVVWSPARVQFWQSLPDGHCAKFCLVSDGYLFYALPITLAGFLVQVRVADTKAGKGKAEKAVLKSEQQ